MKAIKVCFGVLFGVFLFSCERFQPSDNTGKTDTKPSAKTEVAKVFHYVEPEENIAKIVWDCLKTQHPEEKPVYEAVKSLEEYGYGDEEDITQFPSKTHMVYDFYIPRGSEEPDNMLVAGYELQCYQTLEDSWLGVLTKHAHGYELDEQYYGKEILAVEYKNGNLTDRDINTLFPESFKIASNYFLGDHFSCLDFHNESVVFITDEYWPIRFNWNGRNFEQDPESVIMENAIGRFNGDFCPHGCFGYSFGDNNPRNLDEHSNYVRDGETLAHFVIEDGKITEYTLESPVCGFAQVEVYHDGWRIASKPIAIGFPIKNVLDYEKDPTMIKDTTIVTDYRDGKYVITQQLCHSVDFKCDIFIEFTAKDEQSNIETIRVYRKEIVTVLHDKVRENNNLSAQTKQIFRTINFIEDDPELGAFESMSGRGNGFVAYFQGNVKKIAFQVYDADKDKSLAVLAKFKSEKEVIGIQCWFYEDYNLTPADITIPKPSSEEFAAVWLYGDTTIPEDGYEFSLTEEGIEYYTLSEINTGKCRYYEDMYIDPFFYKAQYWWNGEEFEYIIQSGD